MKVLIYFLSEENRSALRYSLYGRFSQAGMLFVKDGQLIRFGTNGGESFSRVGPLDPTKCDDLELLLLPTALDEAETLLATCDACARARIPFNLRDLLAVHVSPFFDLPDHSLFDAPTLNHAQSIILILRECLHKDHVIQPVVKGLHSRQTLLETLYFQLMPYTRPILVSSVVMDGSGKSAVPS